MKLIIALLTITSIVLCTSLQLTYAAELVNKVSVGKRAQSVEFAPNGKRAYVNNFDDNSISVLETASGKVIATIPVGDGPERPIVATNERIYIPNSGRGKGGAGTISVIDATTNKVIKTIRVGTGPSAGAATYVRCRVQPCINDRVLITNYNKGGAGTVSVISTKSNRVIKTINVGRGPLDIDIPFLGRRAYVANRNSRTISVIDIPSFRVISTISMPGNPTAIFADTNSSLHTVYVSHTNPNGISAIDTENLTISSTLGTAYRPGRIVAPPVGAINDILVPIYAKNRVDRINFRQRKRLRTIDIDSPRSVAIHLGRTGRDVYVVGANSVQVFNLGLGKMEGTSALSHSAPVPKTFKPTPGKADVAVSRPRDEPAKGCTIKGKITGRVNLVRRIELFRRPANQRVHEVKVDRNGNYQFRAVGDGDYAVVPVGSGGHMVLLRTPSHKNVSCRGRQSHTANFNVTGEEVSLD